MEHVDLPTVIQSAYATPAPSVAGVIAPQHVAILSGEGQENVQTTVDASLDQPTAIAISSAFPPWWTVDGAAPDIILISTDNVYFYAHQHRLLAVSTNQMGNLLPPDNTIIGIDDAPLPVAISHPSVVVNIILHTIYGLPCLEYLPTLETVEAAIDALAESYRTHIQALASAPLPLYQLIVSFAPLRPIDAYAIAGKHALEDAAVTISAHLLAYNLTRIPDETARKMGPLYLKRLFLLHKSRLDALRNILFKAPEMHDAAGCSEEAKGQLLRFWAFAVAELVWDVLPSVSTGALRSLLEPIGPSLNCPHCLAALQRRVEEVVNEWSAVQRTI